MLSRFHIHKHTLHAFMCVSLMTYMVPKVIYYSLSLHFSHLTNFRDFSTSAQRRAGYGIPLYGHPHNLFNQFPFIDARCYHLFTIQNNHQWIIMCSLLFFSCTSIYLGLSFRNVIPQHPVWLNTVQMPFIEEFQLALCPKASIMFWNGYIYYWFILIIHILEIGLLSV